MANERRYRAVMIKVGIAMLIFLVLSNALSIAAVIGGELLYGILNKTVAYVLSECLSMVVYALSFVIPAVILLAMLRHAKPTVRPYVAFRIKAIDLALLPAVVLLMFCFSFLNSLITGGFFITGLPAEAAPPQLLEVLLMVISIAVIPALVEELLFRGCILHALLPHGRGLAILASSVLFGLMHQNFLQLLYTTVCGLVLGYAYVRTRSIWICVLMHFFNNLVAVLTDVLSLYGQSTWALVLLNLVQAILILLGIGCVLLLLREDRKKKTISLENGSFGVILEESESYVAYPIRSDYKLRGFFAPTVTVFTAVAGLSILLTWLAFLAVGLVYVGG